MEGALLLTRLLTAVLDAGRYRAGEDVGGLAPERAYESSQRETMVVRVGGIGTLGRSQQGVRALEISGEKDTPGRSASCRNWGVVMASSGSSPTHRGARRRMPNAEQSPEPAEQSPEPSTQQTPQASLEGVEHRLDYIDQDVKNVRDDLKGVRDIVSARQRPVRDWIIGGGIAAVLLTALIAFVANYVNTQNGVRHERDDLRQEVSNLQQQASDLGTMKKMVSQYTALITYALQQNKLSEQEVSQFVPGAPGLTPGATVRTVQITDPSERSQAPDGTIVRGVINSHKIDGATIVSDTCWKPWCSENLSPSQGTIWIVTQDVASNRFYPQGSWSDQAGPVLINAAGEWVSPTVYMGGTPRGGAVLINVVLVTPKGEDVFKAYLQRGEEKDKNGKPKYGYPGLMRTQLPAGTEILDTVMVFRK